MLYRVQEGSKYQKYIPHKYQKERYFSNRYFHQTTREAKVAKHVPPQICHTNPCKSVLLLILMGVIKVNISLLACGAARTGPAPPQPRPPSVRGPTK